jgi:hypothetical protein
MSRYSGSFTVVAIVLAFNASIKASVVPSPPSAIGIKSYSTVEGNIFYNKDNQIDEEVSTNENSHRTRFI